VTQLEAARKGVITTEMKRVAHRENVLATFIREQVAAGRLVIPPTSTTCRPMGSSIRSASAAR